MADQFVGEIRIVGFTFAPQGWATCDGQILPIQQNTALFALLGTNFGGNGTTNFGLPNLQGAAPMFWQQGPGLSDYSLGQSGGESTVTLNGSQMPAHTHGLQGDRGNRVLQFARRQSSRKLLSVGKQFLCRRAAFLAPVACAPGRQRGRQQSAAQQSRALPNIDVRHCFAGYFSIKTVMQNEIQNDSACTLRRVQPTDVEFLYQVYASTRTEELAPLPWDAAQREAFLRMQFAAQQQHYQTNYADADFYIIMKAEVPIGRFYVYRNAEEVRLLDIALLPDARGEGIGSQLVRALLAEAEDAGKPVRLYVENFNRAARLYVRFGFTPVHDQGVYTLMERLPLS